MPYLTAEYCKSLVGKTIASIDPIADGARFHTVTIHFTDGSELQLSACVEHEQPPKRFITIICNSKAAKDGD